ncbi:hypothetical protein ACNKHK_16245 [Shigella flexneri]
MGVEHAQPEKGRKLVIDMAVAQQNWYWRKFRTQARRKPRMGCVSFAQLYFPGGVIEGEVQRAAWRQRKSLNFNLAISHSGLERRNGASGTIKAAHEVLLEMGEKTAPAPRTLDKLTSEV